VPAPGSVQARSEVLERVRRIAARRCRSSERAPERVVERIETEIVDGPVVAHG